MRSHIKALSIVHILFGLSLLSVPALLALAVGVAKAFPGNVYMPSPQAFILGPDLVFRSIPMWLLSPMLLLVGFGEIIGAIGLLLRQGWAYPLMMGIGVLLLLDFPLGTALGLYSLWVLAKPQTKEMFSV